MARVALGHLATALDGTTSRPATPSACNVSAYIYDNVIRQHDGQPIAAADHRKIRFRVKESALTAWIHLTGAASE